MDRRAFLKTAAGAGALAAAGTLTAPGIAQRASARTLRLVPHADVANFDPIWSPAYIARNAGLLVWDTLYGVDAKLQPQRQMIEAEQVSPDELTWTFRLRPGLKFHRRAGTGKRRGGEPQPLGGARAHGPENQGHRERTHRGG
jgi:peptide/nickel transport system substrate-binding protein